MILVDTTVVVDILRGHPGVQDWLDGQSAVLAAAEVTRVEILQGVRSGERSAVRDALDTLRWFALDTAVAVRAGDFGRRYRSSHRLGLGDLVVAATADVHGLRLATSGVRHFPMYPGLTAPY